jgi:VWFA-related protein
MRIAQLLIATAMTLMAAAAQQDASVPTFSAETRLVEVDVVARSKGAPAIGLTKDDFTLFDNGKPQKIAFFSVRSARASGPATQAAPPLPAGAVSNRLERDGPLLSRATILLVDQKNTPPDTQAFAIQRIKTFVRTSRNKDRFAIYSFGRDGQLHAVQELTDDSQLLIKAANTLKAMDPYYRTQDTTGMSDHAAQAFSTETVLEQVAVTKRVLTTIARHLTKVPGRKNLIWITTAFPLFLEGVDFRPDVEQAAHAPNEANIALYPVDARGLIGALQGLTAVSNAEVGGPGSPQQLRMQMGRGESPSPRGLNTENMFADLTGGLVFFNKSNAIEDSIQAAVDDGELTYTLGFYPVQEEPAGASHNLHDLKVEVARRGVSVRYRHNYFASKTPVAANERPTLETLLKESLDATQLELVVETMPDQARPGFFNVRVSVDLHDVHLENRNNTWVGAVDVSFYVDGSRAARTITRQIEIPEDQLASALEKGIVVNDSIGADGQTGVLRIVAQDRATGAAGSVRAPLSKR